MEDDFEDDLRDSLEEKISASIDDLKKINNHILKKI